MCFVLSVLITFRCFPVRPLRFSGKVLSSSCDKWPLAEVSSLIVKFVGLVVRGTADFKCLRFAWVAFAGGLLPALDARFE